MVDAKSVCPIQACTVLKVNPSLKAHFNACFSRYDSSISNFFDRPLTSAFDDGVLPFRPLSLKLPPKLLIFCSQLSQRLEEGPAFGLFFDYHATPGRAPKRLSQPELP